MSDARPPAHPGGTRWPGFSARGTLVLPLPACWLDGLPPLMEVDGVVLGRKSEAHLTLLDREACGKVRESCREDEVRALFGTQAWAVAATGERWLLRKPLPSGKVAHSVVAIVDAPALVAFRKALRSHCPVDLPEVVPHVTLYVAGKPTGIGVPDVAAFERLRARRLA